MAANVESMGYASNFVRFDSSAPWHSEGCPITDENDLFDIEKFGEKAGILWGVHKEPLVTVPQAQTIVDNAYSLNGIGDCPQVEENIDHWAVVRDTDKKVLGCVGPRYTPLQNREALDWFSPWLDSKLIALNTMGSLDGGKKVWVLGQIVDDSIIEIAPNDSIAKFVMLSNCHEGKNAVRVGLTPIRIVCQNTLTLSYNHSESKLIRVRHSSKVKENLDNLREIIDLVNRDFSATAEQYKLLANKDINQADLRKYVRLLIEGEKDSQKLWDDVSTRSQNIIMGIETKMDSPINPGKPSWWKAYNAITEYLNYDQGRNVSNRLNSLWFGPNGTLSKNALTLALDLAA